MIIQLRLSVQPATCQLSTECQDCEGAYIALTFCVEIYLDFGGCKDVEA